MLEEPLEQERFKQQLIATTRSLKKKQQQLQAEQDTLNDRWTQVLAAEEYGLERPTKSDRSVGYCHNSTTKPLSQYRQDMTAPMNQTDHHVGETKRVLTLNTDPHHLAIEAKR